MNVKKNKRVAMAVVLFGAVFFFLDSRLASSCSYPFIVAQSYVIDPIKRHIAGQQTTMQELQNAYDDLMQQHLHVQASVDFMRDARDVIAFQERYDASNYCVAQILERHLGDDAQYVLLDKGSCDGITIDAVAVHKDMLVGTITDVYSFYSRCRLITDRQCKVGSYVVGSDVTGIVEGAENGMLRLLHVSHLQRVAVGALIISSGQGLVFPRGFGIGTVRSVEFDGLTLNIACKPLLNFEQITYCAILMR